MRYRESVASKLTRWVRRLIRSRRAITALEFAFVGPVFMMFTGMVEDSAVLLYQQAMLDNAVARASRLIRTGQIQLGAGTVTPFTTQLCTDIGGLIPCANLQYKVTSAATFASLSTTVTATTSGTLSGAGTFTPGTSGQDVVVQVAWNRPYLINWVGNLVNPGGTSLVVSTYAFRNELYN